MQIAWIFTVPLSQLAAFMQQRDSRRRKFFFAELHQDKVFVSNTKDPVKSLDNLGPQTLKGH
jgi:hypothetical protein